MWDGRSQQRNCTTGVLDLTCRQLKMRPWHFAIKLVLYQFQLFSIFFGEKFWVGCHFVLISLQSWWGQLYANTKVIWNKNWTKLFLNKNKLTLWPFGLRTLPCAQDFVDGIEMLIANWLIACWTWWQVETAALVLFLTKHICILPIPTQKQAHEISWDSV